MSDIWRTTNSFDCECGKKFGSITEFREHLRTHDANVRAATAGAGAGGSQKSTAIGKQQGDAARSKQEGDFEDELMEDWGKNDKH